VTFSPDGSRIATALENGTAVIWPTPLVHPIGQRLHAMPDDSGPTRRKLLASTGHGLHTLLAEGDGKTPRLWDALKGQPSGPPLPHDAEIRLATFSRDGDRLLTASADNTVRLWEPRTARELESPFRQDGQILSLMFVEGDTPVVMALSDGTVRTWDVLTRQPIGLPLAPREPPTMAALSPDASRVLTVSNNVAQLWDARTGQPIGSPMPDVSWVSFSPSGRLAIAASDRRVRVLAAATGSLVGQPLTPTGYFNFAEFSPDETRIATASFDNEVLNPSPVDYALRMWNAFTIRMWDAGSGLSIGPPLRHEHMIASAKFSADGAKLISSTSDDLATSLWDVPTLTSGDALALADLAEAVAGVRVNDQGGIVAVPDHRERLAALRQRAVDAPAGQPTPLSLSRWLFEDPWVRTISPLSNVTVAEYIRQLVADGSFPACLAAQQAFSGHPLLREARNACEKYGRFADDPSASPP
jgi:WD40 repeat protein